MNDRTVATRPTRPDGAPQGGTPGAAVYAMLNGAYDDWHDEGGRLIRCWDCGAHLPAAEVDAMYADDDAALAAIGMDAHEKWCGFRPENA